ncbi:FAD-binding and (Fe-S)-binding domain-containing protein [Thiomicrorhabdus aquaedulcis]|uniref:FAD-binding and (Fe-S)-binding domain-containing protein n=1 Tax=Thiomicrorhabdus aquaedulcis TaxID=2211106 RepID=UPI001E36CE32|nr:FAD-binding and (Fe-S)-binding domain-containing protein [Thiomicrorhabdus aquaedulcis]
MKMNTSHFSDASVYELQPQKVVFPVDVADLTQHIQNLLAHNTPITLRAGGTSLGGQAIGFGVVVDVSKHLTNILNYRPEDQEIDVEPGVIQDDLNDFVAADGLRFAPDTSTSNRAMVGGMIGNNSCGSYSVYYGTTREHVKSLEVILADGSEATFGALSTQQLDEKLQLATFEGHLYRTVIDLLNTHGAQILAHFPHPSIKRRNTGYALDELYRHHQPFNPTGKPFSLAPLMCGSEGTLAVIKTATLNLVKVPKQRQLLCAHFDSIEAAMKVVCDLLAFAPAAIELIDKATLEGTKTNIGQQANRFWIADDPQAVLVCEWFAEDLTDLNQQMLRYQAWLLAHGAYASPIIESTHAAKVWEVRKAGLGLLMGKVTRKKAVAVIEDAAVPVAHLFDYYQDVQALMADLQVNCVYYGHASVGLIHIRPELDLATAEGQTLFKTIAERNSTLVKKYRGALSGEHGDGRIRAPFLKEQFEAEVYEVLCALKRAFDPHNLLNPGVIIGDAPITQHLRAHRQPQKPLFTALDWSKDLSLMDAVEKCNGAGACRKSAGRGVMCPSYQATREENYSTRGRSNLLRFALTEPNPQQALSADDLQDALAMCLGCKACKTECPANVDMARLKAEVLHQTRKKLSLNNWLMVHYGTLLRVGQAWPNVFNAVQGLAWVKKIMGVDVRRTLPQAVAQNNQAWWQSWHKENAGFNASQGQTVWVLCDLYSQYHEPEVGRATLRSLVKLGLNVQPVFLTHSPRALISQGLLPEAKRALQQTVQQLAHWQAGDYIVGIEPSELLVWRDEAGDLLSVKAANVKTANVKAAAHQQNDQAWSYWSNAVLSFEELMLRLHASGALPEWPALPKLSGAPKTIWLHVHCHQKALANPQDSVNALKLLPGVNVNLLPTGCCGMSGEFGYKHYDVSNIIAQQSLLPGLVNAQAHDWIVATGTSCRHQIVDLAEGFAPINSDNNGVGKGVGKGAENRSAQKQVWHMAQVFDAVLSNRA